MDAFDAIKGTYFDECSELLGAAEAGLDRLRGGSADNETLNAIFRAVHSIKGGAGAFGFTQLVSFAHVYENVLDLLRDGRLSVDADIVALLLRANDSLSDIVAAARDGTALSAECGADVAAALTNVARRTESPNGRPAASPAAPRAAGAETAAAGGSRSYRISFVPHESLLRRANEPLLLLRELQRLGPMTVSADLSRLPPIDQMQADIAYIAWTVEIATAAGEEALREVFEFVSDDCDLQIVPSDASSAVPGTGPSLVSAPVPAPERGPAPEEAPGAQPGNPPPRAADAAPPAAGASIRVDIEKLDRLVNLAGELVITQSMLTQQVSMLSMDHHAAVLNSVSQLSQHTRELQESVMAIRAQPIKSVFARIPRVVREAAAQLGKDVQLITSGENTEIDKTVIERLGDPLTHMIRNAVDHGIESPAVRTAAGKPRAGRVLLAAEQEGDHIKLTISDDGKGMDAEVLRRKAVEKGLLDEDAAERLSTTECFELIFAPGFSTKDEISDVSGRGVGMDVVKTRITQLNGVIQIQSEPGVGSRLVIKVPLTLAIMPTLMIMLGNQTFALPLASVVEIFNLDLSRTNFVDGREIVVLRDKAVPLYYLANWLVPGRGGRREGRGHVVIVSLGTQRIGFVVDQLIGQEEVVIKPLGRMLQGTAGLAGATITGDGRIALILDVPSMVRRYG